MGGRNPLNSKNPRRVEAALAGNKLYVGSSAHHCGCVIKYTKSDACHFCTNSTERKSKLRAQYKTPEFKRQARNTQLKQKFGIDITDYDNMLTEQGGVCKICNQTCPTGRALAVDHCHTTGNVRGLLCKRCNIALGEVGDNISTLEKMIEYLK